MRMDMKVIIENKLVTIEQVMATQTLSKKKLRKRRKNLKKTLNISLTMSMLWKTSKKISRLKCQKVKWV
jgi:hypothetical protein